MRKLVLAAIAVATATPAAAADWRLLETVRTSTFYVDASDVTRSGHTVRFWEQIRHAPYRDGKTTRDVSLVVADCDDKSYEEPQVMFYHDDQFLSNGSPTPHRAAAPGTMIRSLIEKVCAGLP